MIQFTLSECGYCGGCHTGTCPRVKRITYHQNGTVASVEFHEPLSDPQGYPLGPVATRIATVPSHRSDELPRYIQIDRANYRVEVETLTGRELRDLPTPSIEDRYDLWRVNPSGPDELVLDGDVIDLRGGRFFSAPKTINTGAS